MRRLFLALILCSSAYGAFGAASAWDVSNTVSGNSDINGSAFDSGVASPGTDESHGAGVAISIVSAGTTGVCTPACSATTHGPGNFFHVASGTGCTVGWYEILSQSGGTATFDRTTGAGTCVGVLGGSFTNWTVPVTSTLIVNGNTVWIQAGTYTQTTQQATGNSSVLYSGYVTSHGDITPATAFTSNPLITTATNSIILIQGNGAGTTIQYSNLNFSNTAGTPAICIANTANNGMNIVINHAQFTGCTHGISATNGAGGTNLYVDNSDFAAATADGINNTSAATVVTTIKNSRFHTGIIGVTVTTPLDLVGNTFYAGTTQVVANGARFSAHGNSFGGANTLDCVDTNALSVSWVSNIVYGCSAGGATGIKASSPAIITMNGYNAYGNNTANRVGIGAGTSDVALSADPYTSESTGNFALNATAGGGAAAKTVGYPGVMPGSTGKIDIGAVQSAGAAAAQLNVVTGQ